MHFQQLFFDSFVFVFWHSSLELSRIAACVLADREDRMAAGSGNISNELSMGEVVTICGIEVTLSCSWRDRNPFAHWLRGSWLIACWPLKCSVLATVQKKRIKKRDKASLLIIRMFYKNEYIGNRLHLDVCVVFRVLCESYYHEYDSLSVAHVGEQRAEWHSCMHTYF